MCKKSAKKVLNQFLKSNREVSPFSVSKNILHFVCTFLHRAAINHFLAKLQSVFKPARFRPNSGVQHWYRHISSPEGKLQPFRYLSRSQQTEDTMWKTSRLAEKLQKKNCECIGTGLSSELCKASARKVQNKCKHNARKVK